MSDGKPAQHKNQPVSDALNPRPAPVPMDFGRSPYTPLPKPKDKEPKGWPILVRALAAIVLGLLGLVFPLLLIPAALIALGIYGDLTAPKADPVPDYIDPRAQVTASDSNWRAHWLVDCESPAEEAFLHAMVDAFDLVPDQGRLRNGDITLLLQVLIPPYRADFMVGDRLVVEVDGATYHSSPDAKAKDAQRDEFLVSEGFTVLRIPATVVLKDPGESARRVRAALTNLLPKKPQAPKAESKPSAWSVRDSLKEASATFNRVSQEFSRGMAEGSRRAQEGAAKPRSMWLGDLEFQRQLEERVEGRIEAKRQDEGALGTSLWVYLSDQWERQFREEELASLLKEWDARAASVPDDPEFQIELSSLISLKERDYPDETDMYAQMQRSARIRWEVEGRLVERWPKIRERRIELDKDWVKLRNGT